MNLNLSVSQWQEGLTKFFSKGYQVTSQWGSRVLKIVQPAVRPLADQMQKNHYVAIAVFAVANVIFISVLSLLSKRKSDNEAEAGYSFNKVIKHAFVELVLVGGSIAAYNAILSKVTSYRLSHVVLATITASALVFRFGCKMVCNRSNRVEENATKPKEETKENKSGAVKETPKEQETQKTQDAPITNVGSNEQAQPVDTVKDEAGSGKETTVPSAGSDNVNSSESGAEVVSSVPTETATSAIELKEIDVEAANQALAELEKVKNEMKENGFKDPAVIEAEAAANKAKQEALEKKALEDAEAAANKALKDAEAAANKAKQEALEKKALEDAEAAANKAQKEAEAKANALENATTNFFNYINSDKKKATKKQIKTFNGLDSNKQKPKLQYLYQILFTRYNNNKDNQRIDESIKEQVRENLLKKYSAADLFSKMFPKLTSTEKSDYNRIIK